MEEVARHSDGNRTAFTRCVATNQVKLQHSINYLERLGALYLRALSTFAPWRGVPESAMEHVDYRTGTPQERVYALVPCGIFPHRPNGMRVEQLFDDLQTHRVRCSLIA